MYAAGLEKESKLNIKMPRPTLSWAWHFCGIVWLLALFTTVLFAGGNATADVPLGLVLVQHALDLLEQGLVKSGQALA